jgi:hypothetical protein
MSPLVRPWMRRHSRRAGAPAAGERDADAQRRPALSNRARERRRRPTAAPTPPAPRPRDQRRSTAPKLPTTQGRRRRQLPPATSAARPPKQPASVAGGRGQRDGATPHYEPPHTTTAMAPRAAHRTSATPPETSRQRSHPPPPSQHGARHRRVSRHTSPHTMPRSAGSERRSRGSRNPNHRSAPKSFRPTGKIVTRSQLSPPDPHTLIATPRCSFQKPATTTAGSPPPRRRSPQPGLPLRNASRHVVGRDPGFRSIANPVTSTDSAGRQLWTRNGRGDTAAITAPAALRGVVRHGSSFPRIRHLHVSEACPQEVGRLRRRRGQIRTPGIEASRRPLSHPWVRRLNFCVQRKRNGAADREVRPELRSPSSKPIRRASVGLVFPCVSQREPSSGWECARGDCDPCPMAG